MTADLHVVTDGDPTDPPVLLVGTTVHAWPDEFCAALARGGRFVLRYDQRDAGRSTAVDPDAPAYSLRDLVADAAGVLDGPGPAHVVGFGPGGWIAQLLALDRPEVVRSLTLVSTRPTAPGPVDDDLPEHADAFMAYVTTAAEPDWTDRAAVVDHMAEWAAHLANGPVDDAEVRGRAGRLFDHVGDAPGAVHRASQLGTVFAALDCRPRWRERLGAIGVPTLVVHGADDPFFPVGNAHALAAEIPGAELLVLPGVGHELPTRAHRPVVDALLALTRPDAAGRSGRPRG